MFLNIIHKQVEFILGTKGYLHIRRYINIIYHISHKRRNEHTIIPIDVKETFNNIQYKFLKHCCHLRQV